MTDLGDLALDDPVAAGSTPYVLVRDEKSTGTQGGTFTSGAWQTRTLNQKPIDTDGVCTLATNKLTLLAGTYEVYARCPAFEVNGHQARLQNVTDAATLLLGTSEQSGAADATVTNSVIVGVFTIGTNKELELQHRCTDTHATHGFGVQCGSGATEIYALIQLKKIG